MKIKQKIIILLAVLLTLFGSVIFFIVIPTVRDIKKISQSVYQERHDLEIKYERGQLLKKTIEEFEKNKSESMKLDSIYILPHQELNFITTLEAVAKKNNIEQNIRLNTAQAKRKGDIVEIPVGLDLTANFKQTMDYLQNLDQLNYYIIITALSLDSQAPRTPPFLVDQIKTTVEGKIYSFNPQTAEEKKNTKVKPARQ